MIKACIFDLDGVIVDTAKYHYLAWRNLANSIGIDFTEEDNERLKGVSRVRSLEIIMEIGNKTVSDEEMTRLATQKNEEYVGLIVKMDNSEILPGVVEFLTELREKNIGIALGSASKNAPLILKQIGLTHYFDAIMDGNSVTKAKPDPEVFTKGAEALGVSPQECIVFEDAEAGVEAAVAGGMKCVGIGSPDILGKADFVMDGFKNIKFNQLVAKIS